MQVFQPDVWLLCWILFRHCLLRHSVISELFLEVLFVQEIVDYVGVWELIEELFKVDRVDVGFRRLVVSWFLIRRAATRTFIIRDLLLQAFVGLLFLWVFWCDFRRCLRWFTRLWQWILSTELLIKSIIQSRLCLMLRNFMILLTNLGQMMQQFSVDFPVLLSHFALVAGLFLQLLLLQSNHFLLDLE